MLQTYLFAGFPRALNAMREWRRVHPDRSPASRSTTRMPTRADGEATCAAVYGTMYDRLRENIRALASAARRLDDRRRIRQGAVAAGARPSAARALHRRRVRGDGTGSPAALASARRAERRRVGRRRSTRPSMRSPTCSARPACAIGHACSGRGFAGNEQRVHRSRRRERESGRRRLGHRLVPPREVRSHGRSRRRRRRTRRRRHHRRRQQPRDAARLHVPRLVDGADRRPRLRARTRAGRSGDDVVMPVPVGTVIRISNTSELTRRSARGRRAHRSSRTADGAGRATPTSRRRRISRRANISRAKTARRARSSSSSSSSPTSVSSASRTPASRRCSR